jgi:hypothetical protein
MGPLTALVLLGINSFRPVDWNKQFAAAPRILRWFAMTSWLVACLTPIAWLVASTEWGNVRPFHMWSLGIAYVAGWPFLVLAIFNPVRLDAMLKSASIESPSNP